MLFKYWFRCKKSGYFTKPVKNITNWIFICHEQVNNDTKSNSYSLKKQQNYFCNGTHEVGSWTKYPQQNNLGTFLYCTQVFSQTSSTIYFKHNFVLHRLFRCGHLVKINQKRQNLETDFRDRL